MSDKHTITITDEGPQQQTKETVESLRVSLKTPDFIFAAAKAYFHWPSGMLLTRRDYERDIDKVSKLSF